MLFRSVCGSKDSKGSLSSKSFDQTSSLDSSQQGGELGVGGHQLGNVLAWLDPGVGWLAPVVSSVVTGQTGHGGDEQHGGKECVHGVMVSK